MEKLLLILFFSLSQLCFGQQNNPRSEPSMLNGILFFENDQNTYTMYFIESKSKSLSSLLKNSDTIIVIGLGSPGNDANNIFDFKRYLDKSIKFRSLKLLISQDNYQGLKYEDSIINYSTNGCIYYSKDQKQIIAKSYKTVTYDSRSITFVIGEYIPIQSFLAPNKGCKTKLKSKKRKAGY